MASQHRVGKPVCIGRVAAMRHAPRRVCTVASNRGSAPIAVAPSRDRSRCATAARSSSGCVAGSNPPAEDGLAFLGQAEVSPPASDIGAPGVPQLFAGPTLAAPPHLPHFGFESLHTLRGRSDLPFAVESKAQELAFPSPPRSALGGVDFQPQVFLDPVLDQMPASARAAA